MQKHRPIFGEMGEEGDLAEFDEHLLFEINIASELAGA